MTKSCFAFGCSNRCNLQSQKSFHKFPSDPAQEKKWIVALKRKNYRPSNWAFVCSDHFRRAKKIISENSTNFLLERFSDAELKVVTDLIQSKDGRRRYSEETKNFAIVLHYFSPKAYKFVSSFFSLPAPSTIRENIGSIDCYPGFQIPALIELERHRGEVNYSDGALSIDGMSIKQMIEFDKKLGRCLGYVDLGGASDVGEAEVAATEALVVMVTGLRKFWKIPIAYFMIKGIQSGVLAGIIREALLQC
eukprot:TCALIF_09952-PA protein Name:"Similar to THAP9 DNA transposase THAP9 (Homo sapiens)" AED:0.36 eAED:0.43 QI:59/0/0/1/0/0/2/0/248